MNTAANEMTDLIRVDDTPRILRQGFKNLAELVQVCKALRILDVAGGLHPLPGYSLSGSGRAPEGELQTGLRPPFPGRP